MRKKKEHISETEILRRLHESTLEKCPSVNRKMEIDIISPIEDRINSILETVKSSKRPIGNMLCFIMYDIESNKVRYHIAKYLIKKGCTRIQKSIFLADLNSKIYEGIREDLTAIQSMYENQDSIIICPISTEQIQCMKIIGKNIDIDIITKSKNTLFF